MADMVIGGHPQTQQQKTALANDAPPRP